MKCMLKITTDYTLLKSMITVENLIEYCKNNNINSCGICDENLFGVMNFYNKCKSNNIKPIIGIDLMITDLHVYLYAKNYIGYQNLLKINTIKQQRNIALLDLETYANDIVIVLPFKSMKLYDELNKIYKDLYVSYVNEYEKKNASLLHNKLLFLNDVKAFNENDANYLNYLNMIENNASLKEYELRDYSNNTIIELTDDYDLKTNIDFINEINIEIKKENNYIPKYDCKDSYEHLYNLTNKGLNKRLNGEANKLYQDRLNYELSVIKKMGFIDYFLIVYDYVLYAKKNNILVGVGRGSAAGSLVSYTLGITDVDPIKYNLLFERFLNPDRITMPDIDIDFENTKRDEVINYVKNKYGHESVAGIMTYGTLKSRLVLRSITKILDIDIKIIDKFINNIDSKISLKENLKNKDVLDYLNKYSELKNAYKISMKLENLKRNISSHAAGVVICSKHLDEIIPICINNNEYFTGVTMEYLEDLGILKMDFLAIKNLTIISNILELIEKDTGKKINLNKINLADSKVLDLFATGNTLGIFQFESYGMKEFIKKLKPNSFMDLISAIAMFRPGPMENIDSFIRRKYGKENIDYIHPDLEDILKETYGIIVYQEQIMQILVRIAGYSFSEADNIRRAMSKKKKEIMEKEEINFINRAINNGYTKELAQKIYNLILKFANYGFNKSHSVSYALLAYQMAYLKVYFKEYFYANLLNNVIGIENKTKEYIDDAKQIDFKILAPHINLSKDIYTIENSSLRMPFGVIKNVGSTVVSKILEERENREYIDFIDFVKRTYGKTITSKTLESLIYAGVFDTFNINRKTLLNNLENIINYASLVSDVGDEFVERPEIIYYDDFSEDEKRKNELNSYGFYVGNHPASKYNQGFIKIKDIKDNFNKIGKFAVLIDNIKKIKTKTNEDMAFIEASDETGSATFVLFANIIDELNNYNLDDINIIQGRIVKRLDKYQVNITKLR